MGIRFEAPSYEKLAEEIDDVLKVYLDAFAAPPYGDAERHTRRMRDTLPHHAERPGWKTCIARDDDSGRIIGFTYGQSGVAGTWWYDNVARAAGKARTRRWLEGCFELTELAVAPEYQGKGVGGRLHDMLLEGLPHRTAVLSTLAAETPALALYRKRGWQVVVDSMVFPNGTRPFSILGLDLPR
ncbi:MAG TPA: GNAT family N-acetyltransferase [Actinomycetota bacterium]|jgi:ribosomal protein S18 acetylase RimI-like enzyme|nr:GNAT family N-acetyltransferase [Actinomycetota bacterium]